MAPETILENRSLPNREALSLICRELFRIGSTGAGRAGSGVGGALLVMLAMMLLCRCGAGLVSARCLS